MRNFVRNLVAAAGLALSVLAVASLSAPVAFAQPVPLGQRSFSPRAFQTQQMHYERFTVAFNSCVYVSLVCSIKVGTLPYNAFLRAVSFQTTTTWNAGTSASIGLGTVTPAVNIMASAAVTTAGNASFTSLAASGGGISVTGNGAAATGTLGGFDLFATITIVGALPTAGQTTFLVEYAAANDGSCVTNVPIGGTAPAC